MGCSDNICGTGGWSGPKPGDPDNNITIAARGLAGAIEVTWSLPLTNPFAVSYYILYRAQSPYWGAAVQKAIVGGNIYIDLIPDMELGTYYYWVRPVSIYGTIGEVIGPASASPMSEVGNMLEMLTGQIDAGVLAQSLRTEIDRISIISGDLENESAERIAAHLALTDALAAVQGDADLAKTYALQEITARQDADAALVTSINSIAAGVNNNAAAIVAEQSARVSADEAVASDITVLYGRVDDGDAALVTEALTRADADTALASQITTAQTTWNGNLASVQTTLQTEINAVDGEVSNIGARWTAVVDVNGLVGGFGVYNNGAFVEAGFDVDRFWIGRTVDKKKPFIIDGGIVYIDSAMIASASIDTAKIANAAITNAKIANAAIGNAHIENLAVDRIKLAGQSVTTAQALSEGLSAGSGGAGAPGPAVWGTPIYITGDPQSVLINCSLKHTGSNLIDTVLSQVAAYITRNGSIISDVLPGWGGNGISFVDTNPGVNPYYRLYIAYIITNDWSVNSFSTTLHVLAAHK